MVVWHLLVIVRFGLRFFVVLLACDWLVFGLCFSVAFAGFRCFELGFVGVAVWLAVVCDYGLFWFGAVCYCCFVKNDLRVSAATWVVCLWVYGHWLYVCYLCC